MRTFALTGGIGAGKSTVAQMFAQLGAHLIDADQLAREAVAVGTAGLAAVIARFGAGILDEAGALHRAELGKIVFADKQARADLEAIVHPAVQQLFAAKQREIAEKEKAAVIIYEIPLLAESGRQHSFDGVIVVHAPAAVRLARLQQRRGLSRREAQQRIAAQVSDETRLAMADWVITSDTSLEDTRAQVAAVWQQLQAHERETSHRD